MTKPKVLIGIPTGEFARRADFYDYVNLLEKPEGTLIMSIHGQSPARSRNLMIEQALVNNCTHIFFLDDDTAFKPDLLVRLLAHDKDLVSALYLMRCYPHQPLIFDKMNEKGEATFKYFSGGERGLIPIVAAGLGACLVKTSVLDKMERPWIRLGELTSDHWCDDIGFFKRLKEMGIQSYCDLEAQVGHIGSLILWPNRTEDKWYTGYDTGGQGLIYTPQINPLVYEKDGILNALNIEGWMTEQELIWLAQRAKKAKTIVEFGSHCGRSTRALADNCEGKVYAVDPWTGAYLDINDKPLGVLGGSRWHDFNRNLRDHIDSGKVVPFRGKSTDFALSSPADLVFIDGDHRYEAVLQDIFVAEKLVNGNGIIAGHDYNHPDWPGVKQAVHEYFPNTKINLEGQIWWVENGNN